MQTVELEKEIKQLIVDALGLEDLQAGDISSTEPLFVDGLGLDSIDALELGVALQKRYGLEMRAESDETRRHFSSVEALARFVAASRQR